MFRGVRDERTVQISEFLRPPSEGMNASSDDDSLRIERFAVFERDPKVLGTGLDADKLTLIEIRQCLTLVPLTVLDESIERHGFREMITTCRLKCFKSERVGGICDMRCVPTGAQKHAHRHVALPERHRFSKQSQI